jgi:hypothetical protein
MKYGNFKIILIFCLVYFSLSQYNSFLQLPDNSEATAMNLYSDPDDNISFDGFQNTYNNSTSNQAHEVTPGNNVPYKPNIPTATNGAPDKSTIDTPGDPTTSTTDTPSIKVAETTIQNNPPTQNNIPYNSTTAPNDPIAIIGVPNSPENSIDAQNNAIAANDSQINPMTSNTISDNPVTSTVSAPIVTSNTLNIPPQTTSTPNTASVMNNLGNNIYTSPVPNSNPPIQHTPDQLQTSPTSLPNSQYNNSQLTSIPVSNSQQIHSYDQQDVLPHFAQPINTTQSLITEGAKLFTQPTNPYMMRFQQYNNAPDIDYQPYNFLQTKERVNKSQFTNYFKPDSLDLGKIKYINSLITNVKSN